MILWLSLIGIVTVAIVWVALARIWRGNSKRHVARRSPGLAILDDRYARSEINRDEYLQKRDDILG